MTFQYAGKIASATVLALVMLSGCKSKKDAALDQAKQQAAATGQAQQVVSTDGNGNVTTTTCMLTATVECVAVRMYQLTAVKLSPLPKSETNIATEK